MKRFPAIIISIATTFCVSVAYTVPTPFYASPASPFSGTSQLSIDIPQEGLYDLMLNSVTGPLTYYNQGDARWRDYLYGGQDPLSKYGCGPTVMAMVITSLTNHQVTPPQMAEWSAANGGWCPKSGSYHKLILDSARAFQLDAQPLRNFTPNEMIAALNSGKLLVILVKPGKFTDQGHFLIITQVTPEGKFRIADSGHYENTKLDWDPELVYRELNRGASDGGPVWAIGPNPDALLP